MSVRNLFDYSVPLVAAATIASGGMLVAVGVAAWTAYHIKVADDTVEVTGSAKEAVVADTARWMLYIETRTTPEDQNAGYQRLENAVETIAAYLTAQGFTDYETPAPMSSPIYSYPQNSEPVFTGYTVSRQIIVRSNDIERTSELAGNIAPFSGTGYTVSTQSLELTYSKLDAMRVSLLEKAIGDARERAQAIASDAGRSVGALRNASSGVVQVLPQGGIDISDYGSYDTTSKHKEVMVTVRASFAL